MSTELAGVISALSIIPAFILALIRFRDHRLYRPFFVLTFASFLVEMYSVAVQGMTRMGMHQNLSTIWLMNLYIPLVYLLIIWQFYRWNLFEKRSFIGIGSCVIIVIIWLIEISRHSFFNDMTQYSLIFSGFFTIVASTVFINRLIFERIENLLTEPRFLISVSLLIYFTSTLLIFIFAMPQFNIDDNIWRKLWNIHDMINIVTNLIAFVGLLCIRKK